MDVEISYFGGARELAGCDRETVQLLDASVSVSTLLDHLCDSHPRLAGYRGRLRLAVNDEFADGEASVHDGDTVAVMPPVAGGSQGLCALRDTPLSVDEALQSVQHATAGGIALFIGTVRDHSPESDAAGHPVVRLDYEAHPTLATKELSRIQHTVLAGQADVRLSILHRVGSLGVGDVAVIVAASAPHRAEAFAACREAIEQVKASVPIWKREWTRGGEPVWVNLEG